MSIMSYFSDGKFYEEIEKKSFCIGQLCWVPIPILNKIPKILDLERSKPTSHDSVNFVLRDANKSDDFRKRDRSLPIKYLQLQSDEELLVYRAKKRPSVIVASGMDILPSFEPLLKHKGKRHLQENSLFVIPVYSICREDYGSGFIKEMIPLIERLVYRQFFYIPASKEFTEGVARFDRISIVIDRGPSAIIPSSVCLGKEALAILNDMLLFCLSGKESEELIALKEIFQEDL